MPGVLPVMNRRAYELALKAALALNCEIARFTKWDRKNYYYPDLPKNYQISQYDLPMSHDGWLEINAAPDPNKEFAAKRVRIIRAHLEEDAGKNLHDESGRGGISRIDLNRTGTPLLEIVSHPDISTPAEAVAYLQELRLLLRELGISDCEMQEGSLRCDANVNVHILQPDGSYIATPIVEVKNLNSIRAVERAMQYEAERQFRAFNDPNDKDYFHKRIGDVPKATAGWDDTKGVTRIQRRKEEASDYRYFPEPDLVPVEVSDAWIAEVRSSMGELPGNQRQRLQSQFGLSLYDANVLAGQGRELVAFYEKTVAAGADAKATCNWITNEVLATLKERNETINRFALTPEQLAGLVVEVAKTGLKREKAREVYAHMIATGTNVADAMKAKGFVVVADESVLRDILRRAIAANPKALADYKNGKAKAADAIKGFVMKETKGMAKAELVQQLLIEELAKS
jgi:aspartyl-tRNA(Asn)/glutamyl-tRNA(Gln) amidotransferase subunit B